MSDFAEINGRFKNLMQRARLNLSEKAVTECLIAAGSYAAAMTPIATSNLLNSQYRQVDVTINGVRGEIGYGANYAQYVHDAPGTLLGTSTPRSPASFGFVWDPGAEPGFLTKGVMEMVNSDMRRIMHENFLL